MARFGVPEMRLFAASSDDPKIHAMLAALERARSKNASWCDEAARARQAMDKVLEGYEQLRVEKEQLSQEVERLRQERRWRETHVERPRHRKLVLMQNADGYVVGFYDANLGYWFDADGLDVADATRWMPLPK
jgi:hypothetical protein